MSSKIEITGLALAPRWEAFSLPGVPVLYPVPKDAATSEAGDPTVEAGGDPCIATLKVVLLRDRLRKEVGHHFYLFCSPSG